MEHVRGQNLGIFGMPCLNGREENWLHESCSSSLVYSSYNSQRAEVSISAKIYLIIMPESLSQAPNRPTPSALALILRWNCGTGKDSTYQLSAAHVSDFRISIGI